MKLIVLLLIGAACSSNKGILTEKAKELEVYTTKPTNCNVVGRVVGIDQNGSTELATNDAINQAAKLKASGIFVNEEIPNGKGRSVHATAYQCN